APGVKAPIDFPKYRKPTKEEADKHIAETRAMLGFGATGLGMAVGGGLGGAAGAGLAKGFTDIFGPKIESHIRNSEWVPDYKNWDESDFQSAYWGI
ncbi:hypothetical protein, partial [Fundidesulfovibrio magnetotacticus]|uniref:hypothetical protein n=1 Tax=Fundidesulfovibrio magnetotacticus TaxID=2730080 RepID=UPI001C25DD40